MTSQKTWQAVFLATCSAFVSVMGTIQAQETPPVAQTMAYVPSQKDVEFETPKPADFAKCKVEAERKGKVSGWVVFGPSGQVLRKFLDTDADGQLDQWRYYNLGIEVYRDIDTNKNMKTDQCRWLNRGGSRWGIDKDEDGHIEQWKILSAAEASREAIRAMVARDPIALKAVMISEVDLKALGFNVQLTAKLLESASDPEKKAKDVMLKSKIFSSQSSWTRFDAQLPSIIPVDDEKAKEDLQVYESAYAIIETPKKDGTKKSDAIQIGEMIRVGDVWKLTQVPLPIEGEAMTTTPILMEPLLSTPSSESNSNAPSPKVAQALKELQEIDQKVQLPKQPAAQVKALMARRAILFREAIELVESNEEKATLLKQDVDGLAVTAQIGNYADGVKDLKAIEAEIAKKTPDSPLLPYVVYRRMQAAYSVDLLDADEKENKKEKQAEIQKDWLQSLEDFVSKFPEADDADDVIMSLGLQEELQGQTKEAITWYQKLVKEKPKSKLSGRAQGALRRLNLNGQILSLEGPNLAGGNLNIKDFRGKAVLVVFWNSAFQACEEDIPHLRALYRDYQAKGLEIVGVALESEKSVAQDYVKKHEMNWKQIFQPGQKNEFGGIDSPIAVHFGIISFPTMFLVNPEGKVISRNASLTEIKTDLPNLLSPKKPQAAKK